MDSFQRQKRMISKPVPINNNSKILRIGSQTEYAK